MKKLQKFLSVVIGAIFVVTFINIAFFEQEDLSITDILNTAEAKIDPDCKDYFADHCDDPVPSIACAPNAGDDCCPTGCD